MRKRKRESPTWFVGRDSAPELDYVRLSPQITSHGTAADMEISSSLLCLFFCSVGVNHLLIEVRRLLLLLG